MIHFATPYYRASWQGGDGQQPLCAKPRYGFNEEASIWEMSHVRDEVTCPHCRLSLATGRKFAANKAPRVLKGPQEPNPAIQRTTWLAPTPRRNNHLKHCLAVHHATQGLMFPFYAGRA